MNKSTQSVIAIMALVLLASITFLFIIAQTTEAGPTKIVVVSWNYKCTDIAGTICIPWTKVTVTKKYESVGHYLFGKHPHGTMKITLPSLGNIEHEVISSSECNYGL
jgi:hypothetical protein